MKFIVYLSSISLLLSAGVSAQTDNAVYRCTGDDGVPTYTNNIVGLKNCQTVSGVSVTTVPAFKPPPVVVAAASPTPINSTNSANRYNVGAADFPRVDNELQRQRDETGRRPILERELRDREERCLATRKDLNGGPVRVPGESDSGFANRVAAMQMQVERCSADIAAIKRELAALR